MKPRQTIKNFHNSSLASLYQTSVSQQQQQQQQQQQSGQPHPQQGPLLGDIDLTKLGLLNPHHHDVGALPNLQAAPSLQQTTTTTQATSSLTTPQQTNSNSTNQDELVKAIQAFYGKTSTEILQNALRELPQQSISPPSAFPRPSTGGLSVAGGTSSAAIGFNNNININNSNNYPGQSSKQDPFSTSNNNNNNHHHHHHQQQQHQHHLNHQTPSNTINNYRMSSTTPSSSSMHQQSPQHSSHRKSVLSLHQQHNQNDSMTSRRLKQHHHHMSTSTNASPFANHHHNNTAANSACITSTSTSAQLSDTINSSALGSALVTGSGGAGDGRMSGPAAAAAAATITNVSNMMDPIGSIDNMFYDNSMQIDSDISPASNQQRSMRKHQQLQKLLKASSSHINSNTSQSSTSATLPSAHRNNDTQFQRNITSGNNMSKTQNHLPMSSSTISPPQANYGSVPKSLLNLAACTSNVPTSSGSSALRPEKFSSMVSQFRLARKSSNNNHQNQSNLNINNNIDNTSINNINSSNNIDSTGGGYTSVSRTPVRSGVPVCNINHAIDISNDTYEGGDHGSLIQHIKSNAAINNSNSLSSSRQNTKQNQWSTILSDDQTPGSSLNRPVGTKFSSNITPNNSSGIKAQISQVSKPSPNAASKEAFLANLQERAARAGVSIGEISRSNQSSASLLSVSGPPCCSPTPSNTNSIVQSNATNISPIRNRDDLIDDWDLTDKKAIESALNRVGARNDLSLLYPPMLLAASSQKQINALSAGLESIEGSEILTKEVQRIIREESNIIYECKECSNLFRSLANLVQHKRIYCTELSNRNSVEVGKRSSSNPIISPSDTGPSASHSGPTCGDSKRTNLDQASLAELGGQINDGVGSIGSRKSDKRPAVIQTNDPRSLRATARNQERRNNLEREELQGAFRNQSQMRSKPPQSNLSKILQSQPKGRLPVSRDNALLGALSMSSATNIKSLNIPIDDENKIINLDQVDEQLVRNSSLAQTLLNEKLARGECLEPRAATKRPAPKRKLLEDCIQKVKRDKLLNEDDEPVQQQHQSPDEITHHKSPAPSQGEGNIDPSPDDSDPDSDMLTIDLDEPKSKQKKTRRRESNIGGSSSVTSPVASAAKLNSSSSALLKALTRPVDSKRSYASTNQSVSNPGISVSEGSNKRDSEVEKESTVIAATEAEIESGVVSPLFDKYICDICELEHDNLSALMDHTMDIHAEMKMVYPCIFCSLCFMALENVCRHILDIHKKAKAHVHRLKDVVRSRSYMSADFQTCSDYPPKTLISQKIVENDTDKTISNESSTANEQGQELVAASQQSKSEGMVTRGKKRVDYNSMVNSRDTLESSAYSTRTRKARSQSADQTISELPHREEQEKAASVDGDVMVTDDRSQSQIADGASSRHDEVDVCLEAPIKKAEEGGDCDDSMQHDDNDNNYDIDCERVEGDDRSMDLDLSSDLEIDEVHERDEERKLPVNHEEEDDPRNDQNLLAEDDSNQGPQDNVSDSERGLNIADDDIDGDHDSNVEHYSNIDDSSLSSLGYDETDDDDPEQEVCEDAEINLDAAHSDSDSVASSSSSSASSSSSSSGSSDVDSSEESAEQNVDDPIKDEDTPQLNPIDEPIVSPESAKQVSSTSLNKSSASESNPSSSGGSTTGGIMKLKIQLKTRPDEKSKVYEIV